MERIERSGLVHYQFHQWAARDADAPIHGIFTRLGGVSRAPWASLNVGSTVGDDPAAVKHNRALMFEALALSAHRARTVWQVHGADAVVVRGDEPAHEWLAQADAMVTNAPGVPLVMRFADCTPILFHDPVRRVVGIAHAGWRGTVAGAGVSALRAMQTAYGCSPAEVWAAIGPSIGPERYQVGPEVVEAVHGAFGYTEGLIHRTPDGSSYFDLWAANRAALVAAGVSPAHIEVADLCTAQNVHEFFSHRAEHGKTGRFGAVIALPEKA